MTEIREGTPVDIAGVLTVTCGHTVLLPVGDKHFLVTAVPPDGPPGSSPFHDDVPPDDGGGGGSDSPIKILQEAQAKHQIPRVKFGPGGTSMVAPVGDEDVPVPGVDLLKAGNLVGDFTLTDADQTYQVTWPGAFTLRLPVGVFDADRLEALTDLSRVAETGLEDA